MVTVSGAEEAVDDVDEVQVEGDDCEQAHHGRDEVNVIDKLFIVAPEMQAEEDHSHEHQDVKKIDNVSESFIDDVADAC
jgi:hypothetical protein